MRCLNSSFFDQQAELVAKRLLGKVIARNYHGQWLYAQIIETEAYYLHDKASHASLGYTEKRKALFMSPGTVYMYYARGGDSLNVSCQGAGNAVLIKSAYPYLANTKTANSMLTIMHQLNPISRQFNSQSKQRPWQKLCSGQTLLCRSLDLKVPDWNAKTFNRQLFAVFDADYKPNKVIRTQRLGIPIGRDEHLAYRFIDYSLVKYCTRNPLTQRQNHDTEKKTIIIESN